MGQRTSIEWTEVTWNPTTGCTKVSEGCDNCYAETLSRRLLSRIYRRRLPVVNTAASRADPFAVRILLPGAQNCTHVGIQNGTVRDRGRGPFGR